MPNSSFTAKEITKDIQAFYMRTGYVPTRDEFAKNGKTGWAYMTVFGGYNALLTAAGLPITKKMCKNRFVPNNKEEALRMVYEVIRHHPDTPLTKALKEYSKLHYKEIYRMFGSAKNLAMELENKFEFNSNTVRKTRSPRVPISTLVDEIKTIAIEHPEYKTAHDIVYNAPHPHTMYLKRLGNSEGVMQIVTSARQAKAEMWTKRYPVKFSAKPVILRWLRR